MSRVNDLIVKHCPEGVSVKRLGDVVRIRNGKDHKTLADGDIPVYGSGGIMRYVDTYAYSKPSVLIPRKGSLGNLFYVDTPFWNVDTIFHTEIDQSQIEAKFLYYFLTTAGLGEMNQAGGVPSQTQTVLNEIRIPVPPLEIQREIVAILDRFSKLEAELEAELKAELEARHRQYRHYRNTLLSFSEHMDNRASRIMALGEAFEMRAGHHLSASKIAARMEGEQVYPCYGGNGVRGYVEKFSHDGKFVLIGRQGALCGNVQRTSGRFYATEHAVVAIPSAGIDPDWAFHMLTHMNLNQYASKSAQPGLAVGRIEAVKIAVPSLDEQKKIASILDKFDRLTNDLSTGLPAEINVRRRQYEYYRDRLMTFQEAA